MALESVGVFEDLSGQGCPFIIESGPIDLGGGGPTPCSPEPCPAGDTPPFPVPPQSFDGEGITRPSPQPVSTIPRFL